MFSYCSPYGFLLDSRLKREAPMKMIKEWVLGEANTKNNQLHTLIKDVYKIAFLPLLIDLNSVPKIATDILARSAKSSLINR